MLALTIVSKTFERPHLWHKIQKVVPAWNMLTPGFELLPQLSDEEKAVFRREYTHKWDQLRQLYSMVILCSVVAAVQGMDQTVINRANLFFPTDFGISESTKQNTWLLGLVNSAPYLCW